MEQADGLFVVAEACHHVEEFFISDEPTAMAELVLIDRFREFRHFGAGMAAGAGELTPFGTAVSRCRQRIGLSAVNEFCQSCFDGCGHSGTPVTGGFPFEQ